LHFLPDGRHYLVQDGRDPATRAVYVRSLDSADTKLLLPKTNTRVEYAQGYLLYAREGSLLAQPFDERHLALSGEPLTVVERFPYFDQTGRSEFSVSDNGVLVYLSEFPPLRLRWLDRGGRETGHVGAPDMYEAVRISRDGQKLALVISDPRTLNGDVWIHDLARGSSTRFAFGPTAEASPVWSPDGRRLAYFSCCKSSVAAESTLHVKDVTDAGEGETPLDPGFQEPKDWSLDGRFILFRQNTLGTTNNHLWVLSVAKGQKPVAFLKTGFSERDGAFSPDGNWVAFVSNETGRYELYVTRFDRPGEKWRVSAGGGSNPRWRRDGKELFFLAADKNVMAVAVKAGATFESGTPVPLFRYESIVDIVDDAFDVTADGQRFIVISSATQTPFMPLMVVANWTSDLKR
jgi:dipeptidyl aminopeptidase/acylaminoacyl peptidase